MVYKRFKCVYIIFHDLIHLNLGSSSLIKKFKWNSQTVSILLHRSYKTILMHKTEHDFLSTSYMIKHFELFIMNNFIPTEPPINIISSHFQIKSLLDLLSSRRGVGLNAVLSLWRCKSLTFLMFYFVQFFFSWWKVKRSIS